MHKKVKLYEAKSKIRKEAEAAQKKDARMKVRKAEDTRKKLRNERIAKEKAERL